MKTLIKSTILGVIGFFSQVALAYGPGKMMMDMDHGARGYHEAEMAFGAIGMTLFIVIGILLFVFWVKMLLRAIREEEENKVVWVLVILFAQILGAIIYYFAEVFDNSAFKSKKKQELDVIEYSDESEEKESK